MTMIIPQILIRTGSPPVAGSKNYMSMIIPQTLIRTGSPPPAGSHLQQDLRII